jgi:hypothetical protein
LRTTHKRPLKTILKWIIFFLIIGGIAAYILIKIWFGPAYVSQETKLALAEFWAGPVQVEKVDFHYDGVMRLRDIIFYDLAGREVMRAGGIEVTLGNWPSLTAPAKKIDVDRLVVNIRLRKGLDKLGLPIQFTESYNAEQSILEHFKIKRFDVIVESNETSFALGRMFFEINKSKDDYALYVGSSDKSGFQLRGKGYFNIKSNDMEMDLKFAQQASTDEMKVLLSATGEFSNWDCRGNIEANLGIKGNLSDVETLWPEGTIKFADWTVSVNRKSAVEEINGVLIVNRRRFELNRATGVLCKGKAELSLSADVNGPNRIAYKGSVMASDVNLAELTELTGAVKKLNRGTGLMRLEFRGRTPDLNDLKGQGVIFIEEADLWRIPLIGDLFANIGVLDESFGEMSDAAIKFKLSGTKLIIERGRLSSSFSAIVAEKGGTIDLRRGQLDMYVVAMPVRAIDKIIHETPVIDWFANFKDKLVRLRIKGQWSEPAKKLIHKQPLRDIGEGTVGFFTDVLESGGNITGKLRTIFGVSGDSDATPEKEEKSR